MKGRSGSNNCLFPLSLNHRNEIQVQWHIFFRKLNQLNFFCISTPFLKYLKHWNYSTNVPNYCHRTFLLEIFHWWRSFCDKAKLHFLLRNHLDAQVVKRIIKCNLNLIMQHLFGGDILKTKIKYWCKQIKQPKF